MERGGRESAPLVTSGPGVILSAFVPAILALADGTVFRGHSIGAEGSGVGEVVFNTAITGYQEILTDPSYRNQLVTLTYPHIGNVGTNPEDAESADVHAAGLIIRDLPLRSSNFRQTQNLGDYLKERGVSAIAGIDTRMLTRHLRVHGAQNGCILTGVGSEEAAITQARECPAMGGQDLAKVVTCSRNHVWDEGEWGLTDGFRRPTEYPYHVVAYDFGVKRNILRMAAMRGCRITVVPAQTSAADVMALRPDGVLLSNGPGDPEPCDYAIRAIQEITMARIPTFGICLGHQLLALASGARTVKMKFGHHGANHPVQDLDTKRVVITSQNHGFAVDAATLPGNLRATHISLFDGSLQGISRTDVPAFSFQGHPEASPGPQDVGYLFDRFIQLMQDNKANHA